MHPFPEQRVRTIHEFTQAVDQDIGHWDCTGICSPWFRGQARKQWDPWPSVFRDAAYDEVGLATTFRNRAPCYGKTPDRSGSIDEWLFLMQHFRAPTRLLDWTESALIALFFAVYKEEKDDEKHESAVWMIHPLELNKTEGSIESREFPNTWSDHEGNVVRNNMKIPFPPPPVSPGRGQRGSAPPKGPHCSRQCK